MIKRYLLLSFFVVLFSSCSSQEGRRPFNEAAQVNEAELYFSRKSLLTYPEFEQYKLSGNHLFYECGKLFQQRHDAEEQELIRLSESDRESLRKAIVESLNTVATAHYTPKKPGSNRHLADPGKALFVFQIDNDATSISTSLDSIAEPSSRAERTLKDLVHSFRRYTNAPCGNRDFFGLR